jgi:hypothetical protein
MLLLRLKQPYRLAVQQINVMILPLVTLVYLSVDVLGVRVEGDMTVRVQDDFVHQQPIVIILPVAAFGNLVLLLLTRILVL